MDLKNKRFIGEGTYGRCYELSNGDILKIFKIPKDKYDIKKIKSFTSVKFDTIIFPKKILISNNSLLGYTMRKAKGKSLYCNFKYCNLEQASINTINLEKDIICLSDMGIKMYDIHSENVFYNGFNYSVIDTDEYYYCDLDTDDLRYRNIRQFYSTFIDLFIDELLNEEIFINNDYDFLNKLRNYKCLDLELNQLITLLKKEVENYFSFKINRLCDLEKIKVIK